MKLIDCKEYYFARLTEVRGVGVARRNKQGSFVAGWGVLQSCKGLEAAVEDLVGPGAASLDPRPRRSTTAARSAQRVNKLIGGLLLHDIDKSMNVWYGKRNVLT